VIDQLRKTPAQISLLSLLLSSDKHREALLNVLKEALVPKEISTRDVQDVVGSIFTNQIAFGEEELGLEGNDHVKALHIVCKCKGYLLSHVMIDNGSALNVCPLSTLQQLKVSNASIRVIRTAVRAFDGSRRDVYGEVDLSLEIGPCTFNVTFKVLEIPSVFSLLLGRPWLHAAGAVPSSLHQKLKFIVDDKLITIDGEPDYSIIKETSVPFISAEEEPLPYHAFEMVSVIRDWGEPRPSRAEIMAGKVMLRNQYIPGQGLGARNQGISSSIDIEGNTRRYGLGYQPGQEDRLSARAPQNLEKLRNMGILARSCLFMLTS